MAKKNNHKAIDEAKESLERLLLKVSGSVLDDETIGHGRKAIEAGLKRSGTPYTLDVLQGVKVGVEITMGADAAITVPLFMTVLRLIEAELGVEAVANLPVKEQS